MTLEDIRTAAARLAVDVGRRVDVVDQGNGWAAVIMREVPTSEEKRWKATIDPIINVNIDFPRTGVEATGFYVLPQNFAEGATPPQHAADTSLPNVGPCKRFSWSPKDLPEGDDLKPYYQWILARLYTPGLG